MSPRNGRRGRPLKTEVPQVEVRYRLVVHREALVPPRRRTGGPSGHDAAAQVYRCRDAPGLVNNISRWNQAFAGARITLISPVWLEKPERIAVLAMLTVTGLLVYAVIQRQVRLYLRDHERHLPGNKGPTAYLRPWCLPATPVTLVHFTVDNAPMLHVHGVQEDHHRL